MQSYQYNQNNQKEKIVKKLIYVWLALFVIICSVASPSANSPPPMKIVKCNLAFCPFPFGAVVWEINEQDCLLLQKKYANTNTSQNFCKDLRTDRASLD